MMAQFSFTVFFFENFSMITPLIALLITGLVVAYLLLRKLRNKYNQNL